MKNCPYKFGYLSTLYFQLSGEMGQIAMIQQHADAFEMGAYTVQDAIGYYQNKSEHYCILHDTTVENGV